MWVYRWDSRTRAWRQTDILQSPAPVSGNKFGRSVAVDQGAIVVGESSGGVGGRAYVFEKVGSATGVDFGPRGDRLFSAGADGAVRVWNARTGTEVLVLRGAGSPLSFRGVGISADGNVLATSDNHGALHVWRLEPRH